MNWQGKAQISHQSKRQPLNKLMKYVTSLWKHSVAAKMWCLCKWTILPLRCVLLGSFTTEVIQIYWCWCIWKFYKRYNTTLSRTCHGISKNPRS